MSLMRVAVTGAGGRLGRALDRPPSPMRRSPARPGRSPGRAPSSTSTTRTASARALDRDRPEVVVHAAAWTDVDGCARDPELAMRRNGDGDRRPGRACAERGDSTCVVVSTNEVFDGAPDRRPRLRARRPAGARQPVRRLEARRRAARPRRPSTRQPGELGIVRTAWLFGPPGARLPEPDPRRRRARAAPPASRCGVVGDEWGTPTYAADVAEAIVELLAERRGRRDPPRRQRRRRHPRRLGARRRRARRRRRSTIEDVPSATWQRPSTPPRWGVLAPTPLPSGEPLRPWPEAMADYAPALLRGRRRARRRDESAPVDAAAASATARSSGMPTRVARSASCGEPRRSRA